MSKPVASSASPYEALRTLPDHLVGEIVGGELHVSPRPATLHALAATALNGELWGPFGRGRGGPGGWVLLLEPELHLGADVLVPDLTGWRTERLPVVPDAPHLELAPDWVCEVRSPATAKLDLVKKLPRYARAGVNHAWIIDPVTKTLEVFRRQETSWLLVAGFAGDEKVRAEPFEALELELAALWPRPAT